MGKIKFRANKIMADDVFRFGTFLLSYHTQSLGILNNKHYNLSNVNT